MERKPEYKISSFQNDGIVEILLTGAINVKGIEEAVKDVYGIIGETKPDKLLVDVRGITGRYGYAKAYFQIRDYPSSFYNIKHALVDISDHKDYRTFYEYVAVKLTGLHFKWFTDIDAARIWLKTK